MRATAPASAVRSPASHADDGGIRLVAATKAPACLFRSLPSTAYTVAWLPRSTCFWISGALMAQTMPASRRVPVDYTCRHDLFSALTT